MHEGQILEEKGINREEHLPKLEEDWLISFLRAAARLRLQREAEQQLAGGSVEECLEAMQGKSSSQQGRWWWSA